MKRIFAVLLSAAMSLSLLCPAAFAIKGEVLDPADLPYIMDDSTPSSWAKDDVAAAVKAGLVPELTGNPKYTAAITREQFAELAVQMVTVAHGESPDTSNALRFTDCDNKSVLAASAAGIVSGVGNQKFDPKVTTNREQIATMTARAIDYLNGVTGKKLAAAPANVDKFTDKGQVSTWAAEGVGRLAANGIMNGTSANTLSPKDPCTVEQSILLLYRVYQLFVA